MWTGSCLSACLSAVPVPAAAGAPRSGITADTGFAEPRAPGRTGCPLRPPELLPECRPRRGLQPPAPGLAACPLLPAHTEAGRVAGAEERAAGRECSVGPEWPCVATASRALEPHGGCPACSAPAGTLQEELQEGGLSWAGRPPVASASGPELHGSLRTGGVCRPLSAKPPSRHSRGASSKWSPGTARVRRSHAHPGRREARGLP